MQLKLGLPRLRCDFGEAFAQVDAGGVDQNVDAAASLRRLRQALHGGHVSQVGTQHVRRYALRMQLRCAGAQLGLAPCHQHHARPGQAQRARHRRADARVATGHQRTLAAEVKQSGNATHTVTG